MKGLILCAGNGTRLQPFTYTRSKCMIPINGIPIIHLIIKKLYGTGIKEIGIVINDSQQYIKELLGEGDKFGVVLTYILQRNALGLADAVQSAYTFIMDEPFVLMLGDNLIEGSIQPLIDKVIENKATAAVLLKVVKDARQYGVATVNNNKIVKLVEKPKKPTSNLALLGAYVFTHAIWGAIDRVQLSKRGEYEITDAIQLLIDDNREVAYEITEGQFFDVGTSESWLAVNHYMMDKDEEQETNNITIENSNDVVIIPPVNIDPTANVFNSTIGPYVYIGPNSVINGCEIKGSLILEDVHLSHINAVDSIFGSYAKVDLQRLTDKSMYRLVLGDRSWVDTL